MDLLKSGNVMFSIKDSRFPTFWSGDQFKSLLHFHLVSAEHKASFLIVTHPLRKTPTCHSELMTLYRAQVNLIMKYCTPRLNEGYSVPRWHCCEASAL